MTRPSRLARYGFADNGARAIDLLGLRLAVEALLRWAAARATGPMAAPTTTARRWQ